MKRLLISIAGGIGITGSLIFLAYMLYSENPPPMLPVIRWLLFVEITKPVCDYLNPPMASASWVCGILMIIIAITIYSFVVYLILWWYAQLKQKPPTRN